MKYPSLPRNKGVSIRQETPSVILQTPKRPRANCGKRRYCPSLSRDGTSPRHRTQVANIFSDAADKLRNMSLAKAKPWIRKVSERAPPPSRRGIAPRQPNADPNHIDEHCGLLSPLRIAGTESSGSAINLPALTSDEVGGTGLEHPSGAQGPSRARGREPMSIGFTSPTGLAEERDRRHPLNRPIPSPLDPANEEIYDADADEIHSTHGIPLFFPVLPARPRIARDHASRIHANVSAWLDQIHRTDHRLPQQGGTPSHPKPSTALKVPPTPKQHSNASSNKENIPPPEDGMIRSRFSDETSSSSDEPDRGPKTSDERPLLTNTGRRAAWRPPGPAQLPALSTPSRFSNAGRGRETPLLRARVPLKSPGKLTSQAPRRKRKRNGSPAPKSLQSRL